MSYLGEIRIFAFEWAPRGWERCDGQTMSMAQSTALGSLLQATYGGNGKTTFQLPDLKGRVPVGYDKRDPNLALGAQGGSESVTLTESQVPAHKHALQISTDVSVSDDPFSKYLGTSAGGKPYLDASPPPQLDPLRPDAIAPAGQAAPHENRQPYTALNFCVCTTDGIYPVGGRPSNPPYDRDEPDDRMLCEIRIIASAHVPDGWVPCDGRLLQIRENQAVYSLIGSRFGGDDRKTFAVPDLCGRVPVHIGQGAGSKYEIGNTGGADAVSLPPAQYPAHTHPLYATAGTGNRPGPAGRVLAGSTTMPFYAAQAPDAPMHSNAIQEAGAGEAHPNLQPYLCLTFMMAVKGIFPSRN